MPTTWKLTSLVALLGLAACGGEGDASMNNVAAMGLPSAGATTPGVTPAGGALPNDATQNTAVGTGATPTAPGEPTQATDESSPGAMTPTPVAQTPAAGAPSPPAGGTPTQTGAAAAPAAPAPGATQAPALDGSNTNPATAMPAETPSTPADPAEPSSQTPANPPLGMGPGTAGGMAPGASDTAGSETTEEPAEIDLSTLDPGQALFITLECNTCHGDEAEGTEDGPSIRNPVTVWSDHVVRNGGPSPGPGMISEMLAYNEEVLSNEELASINAWLSSFPQPTDGAGLYADYCLNCHGADGNKVSGHEIVGEQAEVNATPMGILRSGHGNPGDNHYMPPIGPEYLSDAEVAMLSQFVGTL